MLRAKTIPVPETGAKAPAFELPSAQGGQLRLSMRTARGPVVVAFYRPWSEEDVAYFKALAEKEDEINLAAGSIVGIGIAEPDEAREFARASGIKSYVLYDYAKTTSRDWGLLEKDNERGQYARPAVFVVGPEQDVVHAWVGERPDAGELLEKVSEISGLPKPAEEAGGGEKPRKKTKGADAEAGAGEKPAPKKFSAEEREKIKAERRAAREAGKSLKTGGAESKSQGASEGAEEPERAAGKDVPPGDEASEGRSPDAGDKDKASEGESAENGEKKTKGKTAGGE